MTGQSTTSTPRKSNAVSRSKSTAPESTIAGTARCQCHFEAEMEPDLLFTGHRVSDVDPVMSFNRRTHRGVVYTE